MKQRRLLCLFLTIFPLCVALFPIFVRAIPPDLEKKNNTDQTQSPFEQGPAKKVKTDVYCQSSSDCETVVMEQTDLKGLFQVDYSYAGEISKRVEALIRKFDLVLRQISSNDPKIYEKRGEEVVKGIFSRLLLDKAKIRWECEKAINYFLDNANSSDIKIFRKQMVKVLILLDTQMDKNFLKFSQVLSDVLDRVDTRTINRQIGEDDDSKRSADWSNRSGERTKRIKKPLENEETLMEGKTSEDERIYVKDRFNRDVRRSPRLIKKNKRNSNKTDRNYAYDDVITRDAQGNEYGNVYKISELRK